MSKTDVGLVNVDNTSDLTKPVSTPQQSALDGKSNTGHSHAISDVTGLQAALNDKAAASHTHSGLLQQVTQAQYDALVAAGTLDNNVFYAVVG